MKLVHRPSIILYLPILFLAFVCVGNYYLFLVYFFSDPYIGIPSLLDGSAFEYLGFCSGNHKPIVDSTSDGILLLAAYPRYYSFFTASDVGDLLGGFRLLHKTMPPCLDISGRHTSGPAAQTFYEEVGNKQYWPGPGRPRGSGLL